MILLGSTNAKKLLEVRAILEPLGVRAAIAVALPHVEEDGATFAENARKKALAFASHLGAPVLADDSGLVVPALDGEPGVRSARYAGPGAGDAENRARLKARIAERGLVEPEAFFVCALALAVPGRVILEAEGRVRGRILAEERGTNGFGYDPLFLHPESGRTFAELEPEEKNARSHRANALRSLAERLPEVAFELE